MEAKRTLFILSVLVCFINASGVEQPDHHDSPTQKSPFQDLSGKVTIASILRDIHKGANCK